MRSLVEEAANIQKAIEQAWNKAGNPTEFQVKILEEPERNFFGMVTRSAKVAVIFEEKQPQRDKKKDTSGTKQKDHKRSTQNSHTAQDTQAKQQPEQQKHKQTRDQQQSKDKQKQQSREHPQQRKEEQQATSTHSKDTQQKDSDRSSHAEQHKTEQKQQPQQPSEQQESNADKQETTNKREKPKSLWTEERVEYAQKWLRELLNTMGYENISFTAEPQNLYLRIELSDHLLTRRDQEKQLLASLASLMMATMQRNYKKAFRGHKVVLTHP